MQLNSVVLPAPLGPISPRICPSSRVKETPSRATMPPNRKAISRISSSGAWAWSAEGLTGPPEDSGATSALATTSQRLQSLALFGRSRADPNGGGRGHRRGRSGRGGGRDDRAAYRGAVAGRAGTGSPGRARHPGTAAAAAGDGDPPGGHGRPPNGRR